MIINLYFKNNNISTSEATEIGLNNLKLEKGDSLEINVTVYREKKYLNDTTIYLKK